MPIPTGTTPARRVLLRDQIYERLLEAVVLGSLQPGETLVDSQLEEWLGVSRTPIREAIGRLANVGLVEVIPQKGTRVAELDLTHFRQIIETLGALDTATIQEATPLLTDKDRAELRKIKTALNRMKRNPTSQWTTEIFRLFDVFLARYGNRTVERLRERYSPHMQRALNHLGEDIDRTVGAPHLNALIDAALAGDADAAAAASTLYFSGALLPFADELAAQKKGV